MGFSVRKSKEKCKPGIEIKYMKPFVCNKEGKKPVKWKVNKCSKINIHIGCKAIIQFELKDEG